MQKIMPHLWFDTQAKEAANFYTSLFPNSSITATTTLPDTPSGDCDVVTFNLNGHDFMAISAGPLFKPNPSISFMLNFDPSKDSNAKAQLTELWGKLLDGGKALMPLQEYPFSKLYGWVQDKYGFSWQLILTDPEGEPRPFIIPSLLFAGDAQGKAEEAMQFYTSVFKNAKQGMIARYTEDTGSAKKDTVMFADLLLEDQWFACMDSAGDQSNFNEAISLLINCDSQEEIDYYWQKLSAVPQAEQCGWLKDKFGVVWQVSPQALTDMMNNGTPEQVARLTKAFLSMKKLDLATLEAAYKG